MAGVSAVSSYTAPVAQVIANMQMDGFEVFTCSSWEYSAADVLTWHSLNPEDYADWGGYGTARDLRYQPKANQPPTAQELRAMQWGPAADEAPEPCAAPPTARDAARDAARSAVAQAAEAARGQSYRSSGRTFGRPTA